MKLRSFVPLFALAAVGALVLALTRCRGPAQAAVGPAATAEPAPAPSARAAPVLAVPEASAEARREAAVPPERPALDEEGLRDALRRLARADLGDSAAVEAAMLPFLAPPSTLSTVLALLEHGGLADGSYLSLEEVGALRALVLGALLGSDPEAEVPVPFDGHGLVLEVLEGLPAVLEPAREALVDLLAGAREGRGEPLVDASFVADLERLREAHPELAPLYERLLAALVGGSDPEDLALRMRYMIDTENPSLVAAALARWLEEDPEAALAWAAGTFDEREAGLELKRAISGAVAQTAPVEEAVRFLAPRAQREMLGEFLSLGGRKGGLEVLREEYWNLRILGGADERARRMLVSGMLDTGTDELLAIAGEDPSATVRSQAWITLTASRDFQPNRAILERLREARDRPELGLEPGELVLALGNFARQTQRSGQDAELLSDARGFLVELYRDRSQPDWVRQRTLEKLAGLVPDDEFARLREER